MQKFSCMLLALIGSIWECMLGILIYLLLKKWIFRNYLKVFISYVSKVKFFLTTGMPQTYSGWENMSFVSLIITIVCNVKNESCLYVIIAN